MSWKKFYVYQYLNEDGTPFYIGKGSKNRINESHDPWIKIPSIEYREIIEDNLTEKEAFDLELKLIKKFGRKIDGGILENKKITRWVAQAGWNHSEETKKKISEKNSGKNRTKEQIERYKKPKSKEHIEKIRQANLGRISDENRNSKIRNSMKSKRWFTDGEKSIFCNPENQPNGYFPGRMLKGKSNVLA